MNSRGGEKRGQPIQHGKPPLSQAFNAPTCAAPGWGSYGTYSQRNPDFSSPGDKKTYNRWTPFPTTELIPVGERPRGSRVSPTAGPLEAGRPRRGGRLVPPLRRAPVAARPQPPFGKAR